MKNFRQLSKRIMLKPKNQNEEIWIKYNTPQY